MKKMAADTRLMTNEVSSDEGWSNSIYRWKNLDYKKVSPSWSPQEELLPKGGERGGKELIIVSVASLSSIYTSSCIFYPSVSSEVAFLSFHHGVWDCRIFDKIT